MVLGIYGAGGLGRGLYDMIVNNQDCSQWDGYFFIDDMAEEGDFYGIKRIHFESLASIYDMNACEILIAVGEPSNREKLYLKVKRAGYKMATYIDDKALVSKTAVINEGVIIYPFSIIDSQAIVGVNSFIQEGSVIGHDAKIGQSTVVSSYSIVGGETSVGNQTFLGLHVAVRDRLSIGNSVIAAMGSVVFHNIEDNMTVLGNPARVTKGNESRKVWN